MFAAVFGVASSPLAGPPAPEQRIPEPVRELLANADPEAGEKVFLLCQTCHSADETGEHAIGPNLWGVVGRDIGSARGYEYSPAMKAKEGVWDPDSLNAYLWNPQRFVPNTRMAFPGIQDRANVIAHLRNFSDSPPPLPVEPEEKAASDSTGDHKEWAGLPPGPGRDDVFYTCQICHSLAIVRQQGLSRSLWEETLEWMVEEQGMKEPDAASRRRILDYLTAHFGPDRQSM